MAAAAAGGAADIPTSESPRDAFRVLELPPSPAPVATTPGGDKPLAELLASSRASRERVAGLLFSAAHLRSPLAAVSPNAAVVPSTAPSPKVAAMTTQEGVAEEAATA